MVEKVLADTGLPPGNLALEVTESTFIADSSVANVTLTRLRAQGIRVAIDDFGTGYSSLAQLKELPADVLKIDRQFIADLDSSGGASGIVEVIITLARTFGLQVVAEGVETSAQCQQLRALGCSYGQGYLWAPPVSAAELAELLHRGSADEDDHQDHRVKRLVVAEHTAQATGRTPDPLAHSAIPLRCFRERS